MKKVFLVLYFLNMALIGYSQNLTVAVADFTARSGYSEVELGNITELFAGFLLDTRAVRVLTRSQWGAILREFDFQFSGYVADTEIRRLGQALGASAVITGTLMKLGNSNILNLSLLNVESGEMQSAARRTFNNLDEFMELLPALSADIVRMLEPPSSFVGVWDSRDAGWIWEFNNDGTFIISNYRSGNSLGESRRVSGIMNWREIEGTVRGTYSFTNSTLSLNYTITGNELRWIDTAGSGNETRRNYSQSGSCTISYNISSDKRQISFLGSDSFMRFDDNPSKFVNILIKR